MMNIKPTQLESGNMSLSREKLIDVKKLQERYFGEPNAPPFKNYNVITNVIMYI